MSLAAVIRALHSAGIEPTGRELAEALWLAQHLATQPVPTAASPVQQQEEAHNDEQNDEQADASMPASASASTAPISLGTTDSTAPDSRIRGHPVRIPDIPGLRQRRDIQRALRPLRRYGPSPHRQVIHEDSTATFIANTGIWAPVMRPAPERWFDVVLAVDSSSSMDLWRPLISDLHTVLAGTGAFRDVRDWQLTPHEQAAVVRP